MVIIEGMSAAFVEARWAELRLQLEAPATSAGECGGRHGNWTSVVFRGETQETERAYCTSCERLLRGHVSPWARAAIDAWLATPYMARRQMIGRRNSRRIELALRRRAARSLGRTWTPQTIA